MLLRASDTNFLDFEVVDLDTKQAVRGVIWADTKKCEYRHVIRIDPYEEERVQANIIIRERARN
jgi:hypothetical protein